MLFSTAPLPFISSQMQGMGGREVEAAANSLLTKGVQHLVQDIWDQPWCMRQLENDDCVLSSVWNLLNEPELYVIWDQGSP